MKLVVCFVVAALGSAACHESSRTAPDAKPPEQGPPIGFTFEAVGDRSFASFGWTGTIHNLRVPDGTPFGVSATCPSADGVCTFQGPTDPISAVNRRRCLNHMRDTCKVDADCPADPAASRKCVYIYDPPTGTPITAAPGKVGACGWSYITVAPPGSPPTISGTLDLTSGELNLQNLSLFLPLNGTSGTYRGSCTECVGDTKANDGIKDGVCTPTSTSDPSPDAGQKCDVNRYGNVAGFEGSYSMDCSPTVQANDQPANRFGGTFTSSGYQISITAASPNCTDPRYAGEKCFCGMCPAKTGVPPHPCLSNADCGGDTCGQLPDNCNPNGAPLDANFMPNPDFDPTHLPNQCKTMGNEDKSGTAPNSCANGMCNWNAAEGTGTCKSTLNGQTVGCYPSGMGATIKANGGATKSGSVWIVDTATAFCTPSLGALNNAQLGLPGLTFQKRSFRIISEYAK